MALNPRQENMSEENNEGWHSVADWGDYDIYNGRHHNITHDLNGSKGAAEAVCRRLQHHGFGGEGRVFPVKTWVTKTPPK